MLCHFCFQMCFNFNGNVYILLEVLYGFLNILVILYFLCCLLIFLIYFYLLKVLFFSDNFNIRGFCHPLSWWLHCVCVCVWLCLHLRLVHVNLFKFFCGNLLMAKIKVFISENINVCLYHKLMKINSSERLNQFIFL